MTTTEIRTALLLSIQRALLGMIYPSIRAIAVKFNGLQKLEVIYYLDRAPGEADYENLSDVVSEVCADIIFAEIEERCVYAKEPFLKLDDSVTLVYYRRE